MHFTPFEVAILGVISEKLGTRKEAMITVAEITSSFVDPKDKSFEGRNKSMLTIMRHLSIKTMVSNGSILLERHAPVRNGRRVTNGMGNKAEYIAKRKPH